LASLHARSTLHSARQNENNDGGSQHEPANHWAIGAVVTAVNGTGAAFPTVERPIRVTVSIGHNAFPPTSSLGEERTCCCLGSLANRHGGFEAIQEHIAMSRMALGVAKTGTRQASAAGAVPRDVFAKGGVARFPILAVEGTVGCFPSLPFDGPLMLEGRLDVPVIRSPRSPFRSPSQSSRRKAGVQDEGNKTSAHCGSPVC
jgi:hypothetical protein